MLDKHNRYISDENTGIDMLYKGIELSNAEFVINKDLLMFQEFAKDLDVNLLKILGDDDYDRINTYNIPEHYKWQMVQQQYVEPTVQSWFFVYLSDEKNILLPFVASDDETQQLLDAWDDFCENEPAPDWVVMEDEHMRLLVHEHKSLLAKKTQIDDHLKQVEKAMKERAGDNNVSSFGCKIQTIERKGSVDYSKIEAIKDADLEQFRKPSTTYQKISYAKGE